MDLDFYRLTEENMKHINLSTLKFDSAKIANIHPRTDAIRAARVAVTGALVRIITQDDPKPPDVEDWPPLDAVGWLMTRTMMYRELKGGKWHKYMPKARTWFDSGAYLMDPKDWGDGEPETEDHVKRLAEASRKDA